MIAHPDSVTPQMLAEGSPFMQERMVWVREQEERAAADPHRKLDLSGMPSPGGNWQRSLGQSLGQMLPGLVAMLLTLAAAVAVTTWRFRRYELS